MHLPADKSRCLNDDCAEKEDCLRWLGRKDDHPRVVISENMNPYGRKDCPACPRRIPK